MSKRNRLTIYLHAPGRPFTNGEKNAIRSRVQSLPPTVEIDKWAIDELEHHYFHLELLVDTTHREGQIRTFLQSFLQGAGAFRLEVRFYLAHDWFEPEVEINKEPGQQAKFRRKIPVPTHQEEETDI